MLNIDVLMFTCTVLDLNATVDRLRAGTPGSRFETVDFRPEGGGAAVTLSSDVVKTSSRRVEDDDDDDDVEAAMERVQLNDTEQTITSHAWDMAESSPC